MAARNLPAPRPDAILPLPAYVVPLGPRRQLRLQRLPAGNFRLVFEAQGKTDYYVTYATVELAAATAMMTLMGMAALCRLVDERGLPNVG
jgi:hypothetical protein